MSTITRRHLLTGASMLPAALQQLPAQRAGGKNNVLFIAIDDLNNWIGCLGGHPQTKTPNLDRLAARGVLFTKAYCAAPLCNPSRAALMTGVRPATSGVYDSSQPFRQSPAKDPDTVAQHFRANGYKTLGSGKIFHDAFPDPASWDEWYPKPEQQKPPDPVPDNRPLNGIPDTAQFDWGPIKKSDSEMGDYKVVDYVSSQLKKQHDKPFFLACGIFKPHLPWYVPEKYFDMHPLSEIKLPSIKEDDLEDIPPLGKKMAKAQGDHANVIRYKQYHRAAQSYLAAITFADAQVGRVIDALDASPHKDNTTIVLWSDHGWHLGQKLHWRKFALWEEATHNVFMMVAPGVTKPGRCTHPVSLMDIYPTLVELHGLSKKSGLEGVSLVPLLKNPAATWERPALTTYGRNNHSVRSDRFRYIRYSDGTEELYDHQDDDLEWHNLAGDPKYATVKRDLARWLPQVNSPDSVRTRGGGE